MAGNTARSYAAESRMHGPLKIIGGPLPAGDGAGGQLIVYAAGPASGGLGAAVFSVSATGAVVAASAAIGTGGAVLTKVLKGTISVVVPTQAAATSADIADIAVTGAAVGDSVILNPPTTAVESGLTFYGRCKAAGFITVNIGNLKAAAALTGSTTNWNYAIISIV